MQSKWAPRHADSLVKKASVRTCKSTVVRESAVYLDVASVVPKSTVRFCQWLRRKEIGGAARHVDSLVKKRAVRFRNMANAKDSATRVVGYVFKKSAELPPGRSCNTNKACAMVKKSVVTAGAIPLPSPTQ